MLALIAAAPTQLLVPPARMIPRPYDLLTSENDTFVHLFTLRSMPVYMGVALPGTSIRNDVLADMSWHISASTGMVQLHPLAPLEYVYLHQHNAVVGNTWQQHHDSFAAVIAARQPKHVLEIGGGHGYLAMKLLFSGAVGQWTMVDPNPINVFPMPKLKIIRNYIEDVASVPATVDAVVHSHTLEHIYNPNAFFGKLREIMPIDSLHIFSVPNLAELLKLDSPCLHFEHSYLVREQIVDVFLEKHGFEIIKKEAFGGVHSIFYVSALRKKLDSDFTAERGGAKRGKMTALSSTGNPTAPTHFRESNKIVRRWHARMVSFVEMAGPRLSENRSLNFLYAAHVGTQYLLAMGLPMERFAAILDVSALTSFTLRSLLLRSHRAHVHFALAQNNPDKVGQRMYGTSLHVLEPSTLLGVDAPRVVLRQGAYNHEISQQLFKLNPSVVIIQPSKGAEAHNDNNE